MYVLVCTINGCTYAGATEIEDDSCKDFVELRDARPVFWRDAIGEYHELTREQRFYAAAGTLKFTTGPKVPQAIVMQPIEILVCCEETREAWA